MSVVGYLDGYINENNQEYGLTDLVAQNGVKANTQLIADTVGWSGKNLNRTKYVGTTSASVVWKANSNNSITAVSGTATGNNADIANNSVYGFVAPFSAQVKLTGGISSSKCLYPYDWTDSARPYKDSTKSARLSATDNQGGDTPLEFYMEKGHNYSICGRITQGTSVSNDTMYPMVTRADILDGSFESPHNSVEETLRDAEVIEGKNQLDNKATSGSTNGTTYTVNDKKQITFKTTPSGNFNIPINTSFKLPAGKYVLSGISGGSGSTYYLQGFGNVDYTTGSGIFVGNGSVEFTLTAENTITLALYIRTGFGGTETTVSPMICTKEEWDKSQEYKPYFIPLKDSAFPRDEQAVLGARQFLPVTIENLKKYNTTGTWDGNAYSKNSLVFTVTADSKGNVTEIDMDGTPSAYADMFILPWTQNILPQTEELVLKGCPSGGANDKYRLLVQFNDTAADAGAVSHVDFGSGVTIPKTSLSKAYFRVAFSDASGNQVSHKKFYPIIKLPTDPSNDMTPYAMTNEQLTGAVKEEQVTGMTWTAQATTKEMYAYRFGKVVQVYGYIEPTTAVNVWGEVVSNLPKPKTYAYMSDVKTDSALSLEPSGNVGVIIAATALNVGTRYKFAFTYITSD